MVFRPKKVTTRKAAEEDAQKFREWAARQAQLDYGYNKKGKTRRSWS